MAAKTKINDHGDVIFSEEDAIELLYTDPTSTYQNFTSTTQTSIQRVSKS